MTQPINEGQRRMIFALLKQLGLAPDRRHEIIAALTEGRTEHTSELTQAEAGKVIDFLAARTGQQKKPASSADRRPGRASSEQLWKIRQLERELKWNDDPERLKGFLRKKARVDNIQWLTPLKASNVIEGLKNILAKNGKEVKSDAAAGR